MDYDRNLDTLPEDLPDLPTCPHCGGAWTDLLAHSVSGDAACVIVQCADDHELWFGIVRDTDMGWVQLNVGGATVVGSTVHAFLGHHDQ